MMFGLEAGDADDDQVDGDDEVEQPGDEKDQNAGDQRDERLQGEQINDHRGTGIPERRPGWPRGWASDYLSGRFVADY